MIDEAAGRHGLPSAFVRSVAKAESGLRPDAVSHAGAIGVMQLMPATAASLNADPKDPEQNIEAGTRYLRDLLVKYDGDAARALAAYNAGPGAVDHYNGVPPYSETQTYVDRVIQDYKKSAH
jgi:soluble lytic murein transglycosylase-like protein